MTTKAIFLDRDGVINQLVYNPETGEYESPLFEKDLKIIPKVFESLKKLKDNDFLLFVVSNQPNYAKGKASLETLHKIHQLLSERMINNGIDFNEYFYCYHHPQGTVKDYSRECPCRKPKPYFLFKAREKYDIDMRQSWIVGDQDCDILCGQAAGVNTILVEEKHSKNKRGKIQPNYYADSLDKAVDIILKQNSPRS